MKKFTKKAKIITAIVAVALVVGGLALASQSELLQGKLGVWKKAPVCNTPVENFDPNPDTVVEYGDAVKFKWNGPGCSKYNWTQYLVCFENVKNAKEYTCIGGGTNNSYDLVSEEDWKYIDAEMKSLMSSNKVEMYWYVQSRFGNAFKGETFASRPWKFSYTK